MKHRFLLIGHGGIAGAYVEAIAQTPNAELVGVVGRDADRARDFADRHGIAYSGSDLPTVAAQSGATAAVICTPNGVHDEGVVAAADLGLHCLCEKPLHIDPAVQRRMVAHCERQGVLLAVSYMRRFTPHLLWIKEIIESGSLGRVTVADASLKHYRMPEYYQDEWHGTAAIDGGGPFMQQAIHLIDTVQWLCGGWAEVLTAARFAVHHDIEVEDHGYAVVRYRNGAVGSITASTACAGMNSERLEISGTLGSIVANFEGIIELAIPGATPPDFESYRFERKYLFQRLVGDFVRAMEEGGPPAVTGVSGSTATELVREIYDKAGMSARS